MSLATALAGVLLAATVPHPVTAFEPTDADPQALRDAWALQVERGPADYRTSVRLSCFCPVLRPVWTDVTAGEDGDTVTSVTHPRSDEQIAEDGYAVDDLFRLLSRAYAEADSVEVEYGARGLPRTIFIDWDERMADEEQSFTVRQWRLTP